MRLGTILAGCLATTAAAEVVVRMPPPPAAVPAVTADPNTPTASTTASTTASATASDQALDNFARGEPAKDRAGNILVQMALPLNGGGVGVEGGGASYFNGTYGPGYGGWPFWGWYGYWGGYQWCPPTPCPPSGFPYSPTPSCGTSYGAGMGGRPSWNSVAISF